MKTRFQTLTLFLLGLLLGGGCHWQKLPADLPKLYPCKITIKDKDGNPLPMVLVSVNSEDTSFRWGGSGETNASGVATILTAGQYRGLAQGKYRVTLLHFEYIKTGQIADSGVEITDMRSLMPEEYTDSAKTPFHFEMEAKATSVTFQLEK